MLNMVKKSLLCVIITVAIGTLVYLSYTEKLYNVFSGSRKSNLKNVGSNSIDYRKVSFNKDKNDVFSFIHIQKTGGTTMEKHLVYNIKDGNCQCQNKKKPSCMCYRKTLHEIWLMCRYIIPKWPCGLHPDYATLKECTPHFMDTNYSKRNRRYFYGTMLREPVHRFISEFRHMQRGANWEAASILCQGEQFLSTNPPCFDGKVWLDLTIDKFLSCPHNMALNRQTWMLSNLSLITCNFKELMENTDYQTELLSIAKENLQNLAYFGLLEYPTESQFVFEKTFDLEFDEPFQLWDTGYTKAYLENDSLPVDIMSRIELANSLDIQLYSFAKSVFFERYEYFERKYGKPKFKKPSKASRFALKNAKKRRLKENIPKSERKEKSLKMKIEKERRRQLEKRAKNKYVDSDDDYVDNVITNSIKEEKEDEKEDKEEGEEDQDSFVSKRLSEKIKSFRKN